MTTIIDRFTDDGYVFTVTRTPVEGSLVEWYENEFTTKAHNRDLSIDLKVFPLVEAYHILKIFGAFSPLWVA
jgi:hypothetical protein